MKTIHKLLKQTNIQFNAIMGDGRVSKVMAFGREGRGAESQLIALCWLWPPS